MAIKEIVKVWDKGKLNSENISFLKRETKNVFFPLTDNLNQIIQDLIDSSQKIPCDGIAANQIGYDKSLFIGLSKLKENLDTDEIDKKKRFST